MTGFRIDGIRAALAFAALGLLITGAVARDATSRAASPPLPLVGDPPPDGAGAQATAASDDPAAASPAGVRVRSLGSVDGPPIGLLDASNGGLGASLWQDITRARAEDMLARLPLATDVRSVRALARRLVLTTADEPAGDAPHAFLSARLRALLDAGMLEDAGSLAAKTKPGNDPEMARLVADSLLFAGRGRDACGPATNMRLDSGDRFWVALRAYCYGAAGDTGALDLTRAVMQAQTLDSRAFEILLDNAISHRAKSPGPLTEPDSLDIFLLQLQKFPIGADWSQRLGMPASVVAMRDDANSPARRLDAAEIAARAGAATPAELAAIVDSQRFAPDRLANAVAVAPTLPFLAGQALLRRAVRDADNPAVREKLLFEAFILGYRKNASTLAAQLQGSAASGVKPDRSDRAHALPMTRALMLSGHAEAAARWYDALDLNDPADLPFVRLLQVELNLVAPSPARMFEAQDALSWFAAQAAAQTPSGGNETLSYALLALGTYDALGLASPPETASALAQLKARKWSGRAPGTGAMARMSGAGDDEGHRGDAILTMLDFIGTDGAGDVAPDAMVAIVKSLARMGLRDAAHDVAVDALLLHRLPPNHPAP